MIGRKVYAEISIENEEKVNRIVTILDSWTGTLAGRIYLVCDKKRIVYRITASEIIKIIK